MLFATILIYIAAAGAAGSWVAGGVFYLRTLRALSVPGQTHLRWKAVDAWPFVLKHLQGAAAEHASKVNKAMVAFFVCLLILAAATAASTNLARFSR